ncbi:MAG TPA: benzoate-CoA ligase family protein [Acidimicrobiales bacterium]|nr:benzoate-CoA ligase family protein [Acidimicrobiales bacterium]
MSGTGFNAANWLVDRHVSEGRGDRIAYRTAGSMLSYAGLQKETWRAAGMLQKLGVGAGDRVLMVVLDEPAFPALFLGALRVGVVPIPVSTMLRPEEVAVIAADSNARATVVSAPFSSYVESVSATAPAMAAAVVVDEGDAGETEVSPVIGRVSVHTWSDFTGCEEVTTAATDGDTEGFWLYTSGTTGRPKGAVHRHGDIKAVADTYGHTVLGVGPDDICYSVAKLFFAFGLGNALFFPLSAGASAVIDPAPPTPARVAELAATHRPTLFFAPPGFCAAMADSGVDPDVLSSVRATITAGETLPGEVYRRFKARFGVEMLDGIGSTEVLHIFCSNHLGDVRSGSTGRVVEGYDLRIVDDDGRDIDTPDTPGALWVRGDSVTKGYWQRPEVNAETFVDGWCRTGDVYRRDADGYYYFVGRNSDMIKAGGIWVSPAEVEAVLVEHPSVLEAAVVGGRTEDGLETTVAFVVPAAGQTVDHDSLLAHCRDRMAAFKRPRQLHVMDALPKTATGKIKRFALRAWLEEQGSRSEAPT